jgi:flagellar biosynthesis anti-sigma factor FlgM
MKIFNSNVNRISGTYLNKVQKVNADPLANLAAAQIQDSASFSPRAAQIEQAFNVINQLPEIRTEKVAALRQSIANGTFRVDAGTIADKILAEAQQSKA